MTLKETPSMQNQGALFISYTGLLDQLGASQILPYLYSIASHPRHVHIISFEKPDQLEKRGVMLRGELEGKGIGWTSLTFTSRMGKLGKGWDLAKLYGAALRVQWRHRFKVIHCRSYQAMQVGCLLRRVFGAKTIFDMRGLWVDDRVDRGSWPQNKLPYRLLYSYYKKVEKRLLRCSDFVVVLTNQVISEICELAPGMKAPIKVIPCCADFEHFKSLPDDERRAIRADLGIDPNALVVSYLGSLGGVYLLDEMLLLFRALTRERDDVCLLLITKNWAEAYESNLNDLGMEHLRNRIYVRPAARDDVPKLLGVSDVMLSFIRPTHSMKACSPTKMAESLAMGIPVISNCGIGDVDDITRKLDAGMVIDLNDPKAFVGVGAELDAILAKRGPRLRQDARELLGLENATRAYREVYEHLEANA